MIPRTRDYSKMVLVVKQIKGLTDRSAQVNVELQKLLNDVTSLQDHCKEFSETICSELLSDFETLLQQAKTLQGQLNENSSNEHSRLKAFETRV